MDRSTVLGHRKGSGIGDHSLSACVGTLGVGVCSGAVWCRGGVWEYAEKGYTVEIREIMRT